MPIRYLVGQEYKINVKAVNEATAVLPRNVDIDVTSKSCRRRPSTERVQSFHLNDFWLIVERPLPTDKVQCFDYGGSSEHCPNSTEKFRSEDDKTVSLEIAPNYRNLNIRYDENIFRSSEFRSLTGFSFDTRFLEFLSVSKTAMLIWFVLWEMRISSSWTTNEFITNINPPLKTNLCFANTI